MIQIIPAIDLMNGKCVRLNKGAFDRVTTYSVDPVDMALQFESAGIRRIHVADLDGARTGSPANLSVLNDLIRHTNLEIDFGGGIRTKETLSAVLDAGACQVSIGSLAVTKPATLIEWIGEFGPDRFFVGADVKGGFIAYQGWQTESAIHWKEFIGQWMGAGITDFFCTDVDRDGELAGPAIELYQDILKQFPSLRIVASGGVSSVMDIRMLESAGIQAVIVGKALYEGRIEISELQSWK